MKIKQEAPADVGVIVGRFQVHELHEAHRKLIDHACEYHGKVIIFLGVSPLWSTRENPLDFEARKQMIQAEYPAVTVLYIKDVNDDALWSRRLDGMISDVITPAQSVVLYGGRNSFIVHYSGRYPTQELEPETWIAVSGSKVRRAIGRRSVKSTPDFRAGVVWGAFSRFPMVYTTVDAAILADNATRLLLGRKEYEPLFRFIGGFAEPDSESFEQDARREITEETGIEADDFCYIGSYKIDDWRYRSEVDKIKTVFFATKYIFGAPRPGDDIAEVRWFDLDTIRTTEIMPAHRPLLRALTDWLSSRSR